jgi:hypothetical protein
MKVIVLLFLIALYPATQAQMVGWSEEEINLTEESQIGGTPGGWTTLDLDEVNSNAEILGILNFGMDYVAQKALDNLDIPPSNYEIAEILSVERQVVSGVNYRVHLKFENGLGTTVDAKFEVWVQTWTNTMKVTSWFYEFRTRDFDCWNDDVNDIDYSDHAEENELIAEEEWLNEEEVMPAVETVVSMDEVESNESIQNALDFGVAYVVDEGVKDGKIPDTTFEVVEIYRVWKKEVNGIKYKFHVMLDNGQGTTVKTIFVVLTKDAKNYKLVTCYKYSALKKLITDEPTDEKEAVDDNTNEVENEEENCECKPTEEAAESGDTGY